MEELESRRLEILERYFEGRDLRRKQVTTEGTVIAAAAVAAAAAVVVSVAEEIGWM